MKIPFSSPILSLSLSLIFFFDFYICHVMKIQTTKMTLNKTVEKKNTKNIMTTMTVNLHKIYQHTERERERKIVV